MASGHVNRANRPNTWLRRPATTVVAQMRPAYGRYRGDLGPDMVRYVDHGVFPLSNDGVAVQRLIEIEDWSAVREATPGRIDLPVWRFEPL
jgi:hypothetical protein